MGLEVLLLAPTGRAAKRMGELCGREAQTIHRCLGMSYNEAQRRDVTFQQNGHRSRWRPTPSSSTR